MAHVLIMLEGLAFPFDSRVRAMVPALQSAGHRITVVGPTGQGHDAREEVVLGARVLRFEAPEGGRGALGYLREYALSWSRIARLTRRVQREDPVDVVLVCNPPDLLALIARPLRRRGARVVFDFREICPELFEAKFGRRGPLHRALVWSERIGLRSADAVLTVSGGCAELAQDRAGVDPERIFLVGNGPDRERLYRVEPRPELRGGKEHLVLWLGAMSRQEGLDRLVEAAGHLVAGGRRQDVRFLLMGPGDVHDELRADVARRGLSEVVEIRGVAGDDLVRAAISTASVCVNVDDHNAMNDRAAMRKVLEYMAMGAPVVQTPLAEMRRLCGDATAYAPAGDPAGLADALDALLDDPERRAALGEAGRARVAAGLLWEHQVPTLLGAVEHALGSPQTRFDTHLAGYMTIEQR